MKKIVKKLMQSMSKGRREAELEALFKKGLPTDMRCAAMFLISGKSDSAASAVAREAELRRADIASEGDKRVPIWYSPKPGSAGDDPNAVTRVEPGEVLEFTMERIANTGKDRKWGTVLYLMAREFKCECGFELGACAGISAMYVTSAESMKTYITVEGSKALAEIARQSLSNRHNASVINMLFDEAIDLYPKELSMPIDFAYIDGHHEKIATIHYFDRLLPYLKPGALVVFDDISWSRDMRSAWNVLRERKEFSHSIDLGAIGACILKAGDAKSQKPMIWDLQPIVGRCGIGNPHGWREG